MAKRNRGHRVSKSPSVETLTGLDEFADLYGQDTQSPGNSITEIAGKLGLGRAAAHKWIQGKVDAGLCDVGMGTRLDSLGRQQRIQVYQMKKGAK